MGRSVCGSMLRMAWPMSMYRVVKSVVDMVRIALTRIYPMDPMMLQKIMRHGDQLGLGFEA